MKLEETTLNSVSSDPKVSPAGGQGGCDVAASGYGAREQTSDTQWGIMNMMKNLWSGPLVPKLEDKAVQVKEDGTCQPDMLAFDFEMLLRVQPFSKLRHRASTNKTKGAKKDKISDSPSGSSCSPAVASCSRDSLRVEHGSPDVRGSPLELDQSQKDSKTRRLAFKQPMSVFVDMRTMKKWWTPGKIIPKHFLAKITKILSPVQKEEYKKSNPEKPKNATEGNADDSAGSVSLQLQDEMSGFVRVVVIDSPDGHGYNSCLNHVTVPDRLRQLYSFEATSRVLVEALNTEPKDITKLTLYPVTDVVGVFFILLVILAFRTCALCGFMEK
jgi:hypothetical protein